jgi:hypothetical protein
MRNTLSLIAVLALAGSSFAQQGMAVYAAGRSIKDQGITVRPWGSGGIAETEEMAYEGATSLRVSTRNFFQGGRIVFQRPIDLSVPFADQNNLLMFTMRTAEDLNPSAVAGRGNAENEGGSTMGQGATGSGMSGAGGGNREDSMGDPRRGGGGGGARGGAGAGAPAAPPTESQKLRTVRVVVTTTDGKRSEAYLPVATGAKGERGWRRVGIPLRAVTGFDKTNKTIQEIGLAGDATTSFWIGELTVLNDATPIFATINQGDLNLPIGAEVVFSGAGEGGASVLRYTWDFDAADGVQVDAEGQSVRRRFRRPGVYTVTLTVSDFYGLKKPFSTTTKVTVNP